jgi:hypothetical protein
MRPLFEDTAVVSVLVALALSCAHQPTTWTVQGDPALVTPAWKAEAADVVTAARKAIPTRGAWGGTIDVRPGRFPCCLGQNTGCGTCAGQNPGDYLVIVAWQPSAWDTALAWELCNSWLCRLDNGGDCSETKTPACEARVKAAR